MESGIYILTSTSGKKYVDQSVNFSARKKYKEGVSHKRPIPLTLKYILITNYEIQSTQFSHRLNHPFKNFF